MLLRYGSLDNFDDIKLRYCEIGRLLGMRIKTVYRMIQQFHERGNSVSYIRNGGRKPMPLPCDVEAHI